MSSAKLNSSIKTELSQKISDRVKELKLVDSEETEITEEKQLGLLLYKGGTVCGYQGYFYIKAADAICRQLNFTRAERWTTKESFDIQSKFYIRLGSVGCNSAEWKSCRYTEKPTYCKHSDDMFLSCTGLSSEYR